MSDQVTGASFYNELNEKAAPSNKWIIFFVLFIFLISVFAGCLHLFYEVKYLRLSQLCGFLLIGGVYTVFIQRKLISADERSAYVIFLCAGLPITLCSIYLFKNHLEIFRAISLGAAFSLPIVLMECWNIFHTIQSGTKYNWQYSKDIPPEPMFAYLENKPMRFKLLAENHNPKIFESVVPTQLQIGMVFYYLVKSKEPPGKLKGIFSHEEAHPYKWVFYTSTFGFWKTYLNPYENLSEHNVKANTLIVAKRVG